MREHAMDFVLARDILERHVPERIVLCFVTPTEKGSKDDDRTNH